MSCAFCCRNKISSKQLGVTFHNFPKDHVMRNAWVEACVSRGFVLGENINNIKLCSDHFTSNDFEARVRTFLKKTAIPSRFWRKPYMHCIACSEISNANSNVYLHEFPDDPISRRKWSDACRQNGFNIKSIFPQHALCSTHFPPICFSANDKRRKYLDPDAVPRIFSLPNSSESSVQQCENLITNTKFVESTSDVDVSASSSSVVPYNNLSTNSSTTSNCVDNISAAVTKNVKRYQVENLPATASNHFLGNIRHIETRMTEPPCNNSLRKLLVCASDIQLNTGCVDTMDETAINEIKNENFEEIYIKEEPLEEIDNAVQGVIVNDIKKEDCSDEDEENCTGVFEIDAHLNKHKKIIDTGTEEFQCSENHMKINNEIKTFQCFIGVCQERFTNKSDFECHTETHDETHDEEKKFQCFICNKLFKLRHVLKEHQKTHTGIKEFECHICKKLFGRKSDLNIHLKIHSGLKAFQCSICQKPFTQKSNLNMHIKTHNPVKEFKCIVCHKLFARKENLLMHSKIHTGKDFQCEICKKLFVRKQHLDRHMKAHHGDGEVKEENLAVSAQCHICKKIFGRKADLNIHLKIHSGIKDFQCTLCQKSFTQKFNLNMHLKTHNSGKEFRCNVCHKLFAKKGNLLMHSKIHTGKDFQCEICKKLFVRKPNLTRHIKDQHGDDEVIEKNLAVSSPGTQTHTDNLDVNVDISSDTKNCIFIKEEAHSDTELNINTFKEEKFNDSEICDNFVRGFKKQEQ